MKPTSGINLLNLTGPEFLQFYIPYGLCILALAWLARTFVLRSGATPDGHWLPGSYPREADAPAIALLRGGPREAVRTLLSRLLSLGLLEVTDRQVRTLPAPAGTAPLRPIEQAAWTALDTGTPLSAHEAEAQVQNTVAPHLQEMDRMLVGQGLLTAPEQAARLRRFRIVAWLAVDGLGLLKLFVGLSRGRNVGYLIQLLIVFSVAIFFLLRPSRRLPAGDRYLRWTQEAYTGLAARIESGQRDTARDLSLAAGIYGLAAIPALSPLGVAFQPVEDPRRRGGDSSSGGCGGGSSCSSGGGGDGGGGGCGGGGCGGCGGGGD